MQTIIQPPAGFSHGGAVRVPKNAQDVIYNSMYPIPPPLFPRAAPKKARSKKPPSAASKAKNIATTQARLRRVHQAALDGGGYTPDGNIAVGRSGGVLRITRAGTKYYVSYPRR